MLYRIDDQKEKIRRVLKGRIPCDKDVKKEITQALRLENLLFDCVCLTSCFFFKKFHS